MALSQTSVLKLYNTVIEDVISGVRESFLDEGVDEQVLQELKQIWETKLMSSKAVELNPDPPEPQPPQLSNFKSSSGKKPVNSASAFAGNVNVGNHFVQQQQTQMQQSAGIVLQQQAQVQNQMQHQMPTQSQQVIHPHGQSMPVQHTAAPVQQMINTAPPTLMERPVPIQIKLPVHGNLPERCITILIPASAIQGNQLHAILTGPVISAAMSLPSSYATSLLQQHVNSTFEGHAGFTPIQVNQPVQVVTPNSNIGQQQLIQGQVCIPQSGMAQLDGAGGDSSDDDDDDEEEDNDDDDDDLDEKEEEENEEAAAREEEPLNSEDDVTDDDPTDLFDTDNVVVCQYDKITRSRNKWKFYLKDGIMNLSGKDYVFQKANGDAEW